MHQNGPVERKIEKFSLQINSLNFKIKRFFHKGMFTNDDTFYGEGAKQTVPYTNICRIWSILRDRGERGRVKNSHVVCEQPP